MPGSNLKHGVFSFYGLALSGHILRINLNFSKIGITGAFLAQSPYGIMPSQLQLLLNLWSFKFIIILFLINLFLPMKNSLWFDV